MRFLMPGLASTIIFAAFAGTAVADADWQTVSLDNNPEFTIQVPAKVGNNYVPTKNDKDQGGLMAFTVRQGDEYWGCWLSRLPYAADFSRKTAIEHLNVQARVCQAFNPGATNLQVMHYARRTINGWPAAGCLFSYTVAKDRAPGGTNENLLVAAPNSAYLLLCLARTRSQNDAQKRWPATWAGPIQHIQQSLHLPKK